MGVATSLAQFSRSIGGTVGVSAMGAILAAGLPAGAATRALGGGGGGGRRELRARARRSPTRSTRSSCSACR